MVCKVGSNMELNNSTDGASCAAQITEIILARNGIGKFSGLQQYAKFTRKFLVVKIQFGRFAFLDR